MKECRQFTQFNSDAVNQATALRARNSATDNVEMNRARLRDDERSDDHATSGEIENTACVAVSLAVCFSLPYAVGSAGCCYNFRNSVRLLGPLRCGHGAPVGTGPCAVAPLAHP